MGSWWRKETYFRGLLGAQEVDEMLLARRGRRNELLRAGPEGTWSLIDRVFDPFLDELLHPIWQATQGSCRTDVWEDDDHLRVEMELPGLSEKDVEVTVEDGVLTIQGPKEAEQERDGRDYYLSERRHGQFARSFRLNTPVDEQKVSAKLKDGVLTIELNKREEAKRRKVEVKAG